MTRVISAQEIFIGSFISMSMWRATKTLFPAEAGLAYVIPFML
jgi:hypothetical protein